MDDEDDGIDEAAAVIADKIIEAAEQQAKKKLDKEVKDEMRADYIRRLRNVAVDGGSEAMVEFAKKHGVTVRFQ